MSDQICSTPGCNNIARYTTRTRPAYCDSCIKKILERSKVIELEPFKKPSDYFLTQCTECGVTAHYRFNYILDKLKYDEPVCRACYWRNWYSNYPWSTRSSALWHEPMTEDEARAIVEKYGFELLDLIPGELPTEELFHVKCKSCGRISVERRGDIGWQCSCKSAPKGRKVKKPSERHTKFKKVFLKDTDSECLQWWDYDENDPTLFQTATPHSRKEAFWVCPKCHHKFSYPIYAMFDRPHCPKCQAKLLEEYQKELEYYRHVTVADIPELLLRWDDDADPSTVIVNTWRQYKWLCENGHHPRLTPLTFLEGGCPTCNGSHPSPKLVDEEPEIASQWHPTKNGSLKLEEIPEKSKRNVWWLCDRCGYEWQEIVKDRTIRPRIRCPKCGGQLGSLAWQEPELALEWSDNNPVSAWDVAPTTSTLFVPEWVCSANPNHVWNAPLPSRIRGAGCPECSDKSKSKVELEYFDAAKHIFESAKSGSPCMEREFSRCWTPDILVEDQNVRLIIEYDGEYWHTSDQKREVDIKKSTEFLSAGYLVVRLREDQLPSLSIKNDRYLEIQVLSQGYDCEHTILDIKKWVESFGKS